MAYRTPGANRERSQTQTSTGGLIAHTMSCSLLLQINARAGGRRHVRSRCPPRCPGRKRVDERKGSLTPIRGAFLTRDDTHTRAHTHPGAPDALALSWVPKFNTGGVTSHESSFNGSSRKGRTADFARDFGVSGSDRLCNQEDDCAGHEETAPRRQPGAIARSVTACPDRPLVDQSGFYCCHCPRWPFVATVAPLLSDFTRFVDCW